MTDKKKQILHDCELHLERLAACLWREQNPSASVFNCDQVTKQQYRMAAIELLRKRIAYW
jgi:hypothetical protein